MRVNIFEALERTQWKKLSLELKTQVMNQVLKYFVSPLKKISAVSYQQFELDGVKCDTFECLIDGESFVLVPGNQAAILGWESGIQGISRNSWDQNPARMNETYQKIVQSYSLKTAEDWDIFVNESMSPLRKRAIAPMLVQKRSQPVGTTYIGDVDLITGEFSGDLEAFRSFEKMFYGYFKRSQTFEESLRTEVPVEIFEENKFYARLFEKSEKYAVYTHETCDFHHLRKKIDEQLFDLLSEDQWEYAVSGATRKLFRWGNDVEEDDSYYGSQLTKKIQQANVFGLYFSPHLDHWELTNAMYLKLEKLEKLGHPLYDHLPLASYYRSREILAADDPMSPRDFRFRKAILIQNN
ncbi:MAG: hypothetical protein L0L10_03930 [Tetragenococcus sp.]|nr:hypothetical protein [Tetragenococcus sp.]